MSITAWICSQYSRQLDLFKLTLENLLKIVKLTYCILHVKFMLNNHQQPIFLQIICFSL